MVDYKIPGTALPIYNEPIDYTCTHWMENFGFAQAYVLSDQKYSYGTKMLNGQECIICEKANYTGQNMYLIKLSDIINITSNDKKYGKKLLYEDIKLGDYLVEEYKATTGYYISKVSKIGKGKVTTNKCILTHSSRFDTNDGEVNHTSLKSLKYATKEEVHWLDVCIEQNKFVPKAEALLSFKSDLPVHETFNTTIVEKVVNGYSLQQIEGAINDIPWLERDDAKELFVEIKERLNKQFVPNNEQAVKVEDNKALKVDEAKKKVLVNEQDYNAELPF